MTDTHEDTNSQEKKSEPDEAETLDFLKDELEAVQASEHFTFSRTTEKKNDTSEETKHEQSSDNSGNPSTQAKQSNAKEEEVELEPSVKTEPLPKETSEPGQHTNHSNGQNDVVSNSANPLQHTKQQQFEHSNLTATKQDVLKESTSTIVSPERPVKKPEVQSLIETGGTIPSQRAPQQRAPKIYDDKQQLKPPSRLKTEPTRKQPMNKVEQLRAMAKHHFQKKRQNYTKLKEWDEKRADDLAIHKAVIEQLQAKIDKAVKSSIQNLHIYTTFLREKSKQQEKYASHPIINTRFATQNNEISKSIYINCSVLLNSLSDQNVERCKKAQNFAYHIKKSILADNLEEHLKKTQLELMKIREKISTLKTSMQKCNIETEQKTINLAKQFSADQSDITLNTQSDFYTSQLSFLSKAYEQTRVQKKLGEFTYEYLKTAIDEEFKRAEAIKKAINLYIEGLRTAYDVQFDQESLEQLRKRQQQKLIPQFYSVEEMLDNKLLYLVKERMGLTNQQMDIGLLKQFLERFSFVEFDNSLLKIREFTISHEIARGKSESGTLLITVDNFLLLFLSSQQTQSYCKPSALFKIDKTLVVTTKSELILELKKKEEKKGVMSYLIWDTKTQPTFTVKFMNVQEKSEFQAFLHRLF